MRLVHASAKTRAIIDDEHMIAYGGLASAMRLAERCDLSGLVGEHVALAVGG
ncbi:hypothetical protein [Streptosporangium sp. KLBMP 9127]|nr:hypothetical protein [Streptosporangium sp. KLBMP 9127]